MVQPTFVVHINADGSHDYHLFGDGDTRVLIIDESSPHDRVYQMSVQSPPEVLAVLLGDDPIGSASDDRHGALSAVIDAAVSGRRHLQAVED